MGGAELIGKEEQEAVSEVIGRGVLFRYGFNEKRKNIFTVLDFEAQFCDYMGCKYALGVSSGSAALRVALAALGIKGGDEVITQSFTFVATIESILEAGAVPVLTDVDKSLNMDPADLGAKITEKTRAIIPVHMLGSPGAHGRDHGDRPEEKYPRPGGLLPGLRVELQGKEDGDHGGPGNVQLRLREDPDHRRRRDGVHERQEALRSGL